LGGRGGFGTPPQISQLGPHRGDAIGEICSSSDSFGQLGHPYTVTPDGATVGVV
jgi:hypothetical protein